MKVLLSVETEMLWAPTGKQSALIGTTPQTNSAASFALSAFTLLHLPPHPQLTKWHMDRVLQ